VADQLEIKLGADIAPLQQGLTAAINSVENFENGIRSTNVKLKDFTYTIEGIQTAARGLGPVAFRPATDGLTSFGDGVTNTEEKLKRFPRSSQQATLALSNLGRVASDAPFGFIAIANNIEPLVQSLQSLGRTSGGIGGALKSLGTALAGPAGLLLAFSLVSSAVTVATQKYGSLGNAISALFGNFTDLDRQVLKAAKSYEKYNENLRTAAEISRDEGASVQGQVTRVQALAALASDQTRSYNERNSALKSLAEINKTYFGELKIEDGLIKGLTGAVDSYTKSIVASAKAKGFEAEIGKTAVQLREQEQLLESLNAQRKITVDQLKKGAGGLPGIGQAAAAVQLTNSVNDANEAYGKQNVIVQNLKTRLKDFETQLESLTGTQIQERLTVDAAAEAAKKKAEAEKAAEKARAANIKRTQDAINAEKLLNIELEAQRKLRNAPTTIALDIPISKISELAKVNQTITKSFDAQAARLKQAFGFDIGAPDIDFTALEAKTQAFFQKINQAGEDTKNRLVTQTQSITDAFNTVLAPSIDAVFSALASGQNAFKALGDSLKQLIIQLIATVVKAAALAAIISAVTGTPFNVAFKGTLGGSQQLGGLTGLVAGGNVRGAAAPSIPRGTAFQAGGLQLAGNVIFTQRGTDLVGVLNRGNSQIQRVG